MEKNIIFHEENFKFTKNNTFNNVFCNRIFSYNRFLLILKKMIGFLFIIAYVTEKNILYNSTIFKFENK